MAATVSIMYEQSEKKPWQLGQSFILGGMAMQSGKVQSQDSATHPFAQVGYDFMGACFEVHRVLGGGLLEEIYQESLEWELTLRDISFAPKKELQVHYKDHKLLKRYIPDLVVEENMMVELKSARELSADHEAQLFNYMRITRKPVGYLVNFGPMDKVQWKRFVISGFVPAAGQ